MKKTSDIATALLATGVKGFAGKDNEELKVLDYDKLAEAIVRARARIEEEEKNPEKDKFKGVVRSRTDVDAPEYLKLRMSRLEPLLKRL